MSTTTEIAPAPAPTTTNRRAEIMDAAAEVISRRGVDRARLADIADEAGVSLGLVQYYFRHRSQLVAATLEREAARIETVWGSVVDPSAPPLQRLVKYLVLCTPVGSSSAARSFGPGMYFWMQMWSYAYRDEGAREVIPKVYESFAQPFIQAITEGIDSGEFESDNPAKTVDRLVSLIDGCAVRTVVGAMEAQQMIDHLVGSLILELGLDDAQARRAVRWARGVQG